MSFILVPSHGEDLRVNAWNWRPTLELLFAANVISEKDHERMGANGSGGKVNAEQASRIAEAVVHKLASMNAGEHALDVLEIQFDLKLNSAKCVLGFAEAQHKTILFDGIIDLNFAPDFADSLPWVFGEVKLEKISREDELASGEGLWIHGRNSYAAVLPCYRVTFESGDFRLKIVCLTVKVIES
jgi:hypothetical protein